MTFPLPEAASSHFKHRFVTVLLFLFLDTPIMQSSTIDVSCRFIIKIKKSNLKRFSDNPRHTDTSAGLTSSGEERLAPGRLHLPVFRFLCF